MAIFNSYVKLPEGSYGKWMKMAYLLRVAESMLMKNSDFNIF